MKQDWHVTLLVVLAKTRYQLMIAATFYGAVCGYLYGRVEAGDKFDVGATVGLLGSIAAMTALIASVSFAYVAFFLNQANSRKHDLYFRFKSLLFEFDKFLKEYPVEDALIDEALALSWNLKFLRFDDFPLLDWGERLAPLDVEISKLEKNQEKYSGDENDYELSPAQAQDSHVVHRILGYLGYAEDVVSEIGIMCIRQIIAGRHIAMVNKAFTLLALILLSLVLAYIPGLQILSPAIVAAPVLFAVLAMLMLLEMGWYLHREGEENLSFVARDNVDKVDGDVATPEKAGPASRMKRVLVPPLSSVEVVVLMQVRDALLIENSVAGPLRHLERLGHVEKRGDLFILTKSGQLRCEREAERNR